MLQLPEGREAGPIVRHLYEKHGTVIAGARNKLRGTVIRFGTMGAVEDADIVTDLQHLEVSLIELGRDIEPGAGAAAAKEALQAA